ncbi:DUF6931 family protein [Lysobacter cavernae]|uniref:DUF6931 family protein n=1 Tax=Lysobacter cavernae TaxID=1685901 RepID=A0ABV7RPB2_9GAMM
MNAIEQACEEMELSAPARALLRTPMSAQGAVRALLDSDQPQDALKLLARLLPKPYAVAWLCQCARGEVLSPEDRAGAALAEKWLREPNEANRRAAFAFAHAGGYASFGAWLAAAVAWSGGSLAPASQDTPVPPAEHLTARAAVAAINLLAAQQPEHFQARRHAYAMRALELLGGGAAA